MITIDSNIFIERMSVFLNEEVHIKIEGDENAVSYILREVGKDFLRVDYGESQRFLLINKMIFFQIGDYPKNGLK